MMPCDPTAGPPDMPHATCKRCGDPWPGALSWDGKPIEPVPPFCSASCDDADRRENPARLAGNTIPGRLRHPDTHYEDDGLRCRPGPGIRPPNGCPFVFKDLPESTILRPPPPLIEGQTMRFTQHDDLDGLPLRVQDLLAIRDPRNGALVWECLFRVDHWRRGYGNFIPFPAK